MTYRKMTAAAAAAALIGTPAAQAACERHIYNRSNAPWIFAAAPMKGVIPLVTPGGALLPVLTSGTGNVWFEGARDVKAPDKPCSQPQNGPCLIMPKTTVTITYTTSAGEAFGVMTILDKKLDGREFSYTGAASRCPYVHHSGGTGAVAVNDPADGDFNIWGVDLWADD